MRWRCSSETAVRAMASCARLTLKLSFAAPATIQRNACPQAISGGGSNVTSSSDEKARALSVSFSSKAISPSRRDLRGDLGRNLTVALASAVRVRSM